MTMAKKNSEEKQLQKKAEEQPQSQQKESRSNLLIWFFAFLFAVSVLAFGVYRFMQNSQFASLESAVAVEDIAVSNKISKQKSEPTFAKKEMKVGGFSSQENELEEGDFFAEEEPVGEIEKSQTVVDDLKFKSQEKMREIAQANMQEAIAKLAEKNSGRLDVLEGQRKFVLAYIAAQSMKDLVLREDFANYANELRFLKRVLQGELEFEGKISLLEYSAESQIFDTKMLLAELGKINVEIKQAEEKTFWQNVEKSVGELVKVTKLDEKSEDAYPKILMAKEALQRNDLNEAIRLIDSVKNADTKEWLEKAYKLQRIKETVEYLVENTRKKLVQ